MCMGHGFLHVSPCLLTHFLERSHRTFSPGTSQKLVFRAVGHLQRRGELCSFFCHIFCPWKTLFVPCNLLVFWHQKIRNIMKYTSIHVLAHELHICFKFWDRLFFVDAGLLVLWGSFFFQDLKWKRANQNTWISTSLSYTVFCIHVLSNITLSWLPTLLSFLWGGGE